MQLTFNCLIRKQHTSNSSTQVTQITNTVSCDVCILKNEFSYAFCSYFNGNKHISGQIHSKVSKYRYF